MPSKHSGSSHGGGFGGGRSSFSGLGNSFGRSRPSSHSGSSHSFGGGIFSSNNRSNHNSRGHYGPRIVIRPRVYQPRGYYSPWGFWSWFRPRPVIYYCVRHNYTYYPRSWTSGGEIYQAGYYDENGNYYQEKPFIEKRPDRIYTKCPVCNYVKDYNYMDFEELENCPNCGERMIIAGEDDDIFIKSDEEEREESIFGPFIKLMVGYFVVMTLLLLPLQIKSCAKKEEKPQTHTVVIPSQNNQSSEDTRVLYLAKGEKGYKILDSGYNADKVLEKDMDGNFFDAETGLYLYYAEKFGVWQYWYEPISSNYGDYGWMEHDNDGWWIEASEGNWIKVPSNYNTDKLWYIE